MFHSNFPFRMLSNISKRILLLCSLYCSVASAQNLGNIPIDEGQEEVVKIKHHETFYEEVLSRQCPGPKTAYHQGPMPFLFVYYPKSDTANAHHLIRTLKEAQGYLEVVFGIRIAVFLKREALSSFEAYFGGFSTFSRTRPSFDSFFDTKGKLAAKCPDPSKVSLFLTDETFQLLVSHSGSISLEELLSLIEQKLPERSDVLAQILAREIVEAEEEGYQLKNGIRIQCEDWKASPSVWLESEQVTRVVLIAESAYERMYLRPEESLLEHLGAKNQEVLEDDYTQLEMAFDTRGKVLDTGFADCEMVLKAPKEGGETRYQGAFLIFSK